MRSTRMSAVRAWSLCAISVGIFGAGNARAQTVAFDQPDIKPMGAGAIDVLIADLLGPGSRDLVTADELGGHDHGASPTGAPGRRNANIIRT